MVHINFGTKNAVTKLSYRKFTFKEMDKIDVPSSWYDHFEKIPFLIKIKG